METTPGKRVQILREKKGYTSLTSFCEYTGLKVGTISALEKDKSSPSLETLAKLLEAFPDVNLDWLVTGHGPMLKDGRTLTPADQLPPQVPSKLEPPQAPRPVLPTPDEWRENMRVVAESAELREVKSERDNLRKTNEQLLAIIRNFTGGTNATDSAAVGKAEASLEAATLFETVDALQAEYVNGHRVYVAGFQQQGVHRQLA